MPSELELTKANTAALAKRITELEFGLLNEREKEAQLAIQLQIAEAAVAQEAKTIASKLGLMPLGKQLRTNRTPDQIPKN